jgi:hypothetical protein
MKIQYKLDGNEVEISNGYWEVRHDFSVGGAIHSIKVLNGSNQNLLTGPMYFCVNNQYYNTYDYNAKQKIERISEDQIKLYIEGKLKDKNGADNGVCFFEEYTYTGYYIKRVLKIEFLKEISLNSFNAFSVPCDKRLNEYVISQSALENKGRYADIIGPHPDQIWGNTKKDTIPNGRFVPYDIGLFKKGIEGIQIFSGSDWWQWNNQISGKFNEQGSYTINITDESNLISMHPYKNSHGSILINGESEYHLFIGLPNKPERIARGIKEVVITATPWPTDEEIAGYAENGINLIRLHNDSSYTAKSEIFWRDGAYPPYDDYGMKEMERVINTAHKYDIKIIPYFSMWHCYPTSPGFGFVSQWKRTLTESGYETYDTSAGLGNIFGALMCPDSAWKDHVKDNIRVVLENHKFDGIYFDWSLPNYCANTDHLKGEHTGFEGTLDILEWTREYLGEKKIIVFHNGGNSMSIIASNFSNHIVTFEEESNSVDLQFENLPSKLLFMDSCSVGLVPNALYPLQDDIDKRSRLKKGIAVFVLLGVFPYHYMFFNELFGYTSNKQFLEDNEGICGLFKKFKSLNLQEYTFLNGYTGVVETDCINTKGALYYNDNEMIAVIANLSENPNETIWKLNKDILKCINFSERSWEMSEIDANEIRGDMEIFTEELYKTHLEGYQYKVFMFKRRNTE